MEAKAAFTNAAPGNAEAHARRTSRLPVRGPKPPGAALSAAMPPLVVLPAIARRDQVEDRAHGRGAAWRAEGRVVSQKRTQREYERPSSNPSG